MGSELKGCMEFLIWQGNTKKKQTGWGKETKEHAKVEEGSYHGVGAKTTEAQVVFVYGCLRKQREGGERLCCCLL